MIRSLTARAMLVLLVVTVGCTPQTIDDSTRTPGIPSTAPSNQLPTTPDHTPWPADLTADEATAAQTALSVYRRYWLLNDQIRQNPAADWTTQISELAAGIEHNILLGAAQRATTRGEHGPGATQITPEVTTVAPSLVTITDCIDETHTDYVRRDGTSIRRPSAYQSHVATAQVAQFQDGRWLVIALSENSSTPCS